MIMKWKYHDCRNWLHEPSLFDFPQNDDIWGRPASELKLTSLFPPADHRNTLHNPDAVSLYQHTQHLCEGVTKSSTSTLLKESVTTLLLSDVLFFLFLTPWRRNSGLMQDLAIMAKSQPNAQPFLCFLLVSTTKQSLFFFLCI